MNANKIGKNGLRLCVTGVAAVTTVATGLVVALTIGLPSVAHAEQGLNARGQSKVNVAKSRRWSTSDGKKDGAQLQNEKTVVNFGSKRAGTCNVNVGTVQPGQKAPKEIVVTTKEVINVCK